MTSLRALHDRELRLCAADGCDARAVATLRFRPAHREAWLAPIDEQADPSAGDLCERHAARPVLPRGWRLDDRRGAERGDPLSDVLDARTPLLRRAFRSARARDERDTLPGSC